jgi:hypothetical protein
MALLQVFPGGAEIPFGFGVAYALARQKFDLVGEV